MAERGISAIRTNIRRFESRSRRRNKEGEEDSLHRFGRSKRGEEKKNGRNLEGKRRFRGARSNVPLLIDHDNNERRSEVTG